MEQSRDEQLLEAVVGGDMAALTILVERYQQELIGYLDRLVDADWALAQDLTQETFLRVLRQHATRGERPFKPWLYAIATNLARDHFKSSAVRRSLPLADEHETAIADDAPSPEERALLGERRDHLLAAMNQLSVEQRATVWLRFYGDLSLAEIAAALDVPVGTIKWRLADAMRRLRQTLVAPADIGGCWK